MAALAAPAQTRPTVIHGWVQGPDGKPLFGVIVAINSRPDNVHPLTPFNTTVVTTADGSFQVAGVPAGTYSVCPHPPTANLLPPCNWTSEPRATITTGEWINFPPIMLTQSADLHVRVEDPNGTRGKAEGKVPGVSLLLAVRAPNGRLHAIPVTAKDPNGFDHHLAVPTGMDLVFTAFSSTFALTDSNGHDIDKSQGLAVTVNIPPGQANHQETVHVK